MQRKAIWLLPVLLLALAACKSMTIDQQIHQANQGVTVVLNSTDSALNAELISSNQAQSVSAIAHQVNPLLDSAKAASDANDKDNANRTLRLVNAILAGLDAWVPVTN